MKQLLISVGKKHDPALVSAINDYTDRLRKRSETTWLFPAPSGAEEAVARRVESAQVLEKLTSSDIVVVLDERGTQMSSEALATRYEAWEQSGKRLVFVIGGAYGVDDSLLSRADFTWSLSKHVFPHQIARLLLVEQLYRAQMINQNHPYHHT